MYTIHEGIRRLIKILEGLTLDAQRFDEGVEAAGKRVNRALKKELIPAIREITKAIVAIQKGRKAKK